MQDPLQDVHTLLSLRATLASLSEHNHPLSQAHMSSLFELTALFADHNFIDLVRTTNMHMQIIANTQSLLYVAQPLDLELVFEDLLVVTRNSLLNTLVKGDDQWETKWVFMMSTAIVIPRKIAVSTINITRNVDMLINNDLLKPNISLLLVLFQK